MYGVHSIPMNYDDQNGIIVIGPKWFGLHTY